jgi:curved DNA-binding protein CbpA
VTHYEVLGVDPAASPEDVRRAYVARARLLHPDTAQGRPTEESARTARAMQDVNEAWRVLRTPASRSAYDALLAGRAAGARPGPAPARPGGTADLSATADHHLHHHASGPVDPTAALLRGLPWVAVLVVLGTIFVVSAFAGGSDDGDRRSSYDLVGSCVQSQRGVGVVQVPCSAPNEGQVDLVVTSQGQCPDDATPRPVPGEGTWVCLRPPR